MNIVDTCIWNAYCLFETVYTKLIDRLLEKYQKSTQGHSFNVTFISTDDNCTRHICTLYTFEGRKINYKDALFEIKTLGDVKRIVNAKKVMLDC